MTDAADAEVPREAGMAPPFPGLRPFSSRDHKYFFGRQEQIFALYRLLTRNHFIAVIGNSGSGKSSIVRAGLLPKLDEDNFTSDSTVWHCRTMRPGRDPINRLASTLAEGPGRERDAFFEPRRDRIAATLRSSSLGLCEALGHTSMAPGAELVLVVDQFEELFRYLSAGPQDRIDTMRRRSEATDFVQLLLTATRDNTRQIRVVITMRSDFIGDCAWFHGLPEAVSAAQFLVPSLTKDQREEAIRKPIELSGATIEPELVRRLLIDSEEEIDQLPVLQHCLARLWMRAGLADTGAQPPAASSPAPDSSKPGRILTERDYREIGGLAGALSAHAEEIANSLSGKERTVENVFRALGEIDKDGRAIRRARPLARLIAEAFVKDEVERADVCMVLDRFRADDCSFIVPPLSLAPSSELPDGTVIDVGHEALLRRWARVSGDPEATGERADKRDIGWLRKEQKDGESYQFLRSCVDPESPNDSGLPASRVERYRKWWKARKPNEAWAERYGGSFKQVERLVEDSYAASRRARSTRILTSVVALVLAVAIAAVVLISWDRQRSAEAVFELTLNSAETLSQMVLDAFNDGKMSADTGSKISKEAVELYRNTNKLSETPAGVAAESRWLMVASDFSFALNEKQSSRSNIEEAMARARRFLALDPENRGWRELLYGCLFRIGDLDLDQAYFEHDPKLADRAAAEYDEGRDLAEKLLSGDVARPHKTNLADIDFLAKQRFDLAFAINKVGEARQVKKDFPGAIDKYREALGYAMMIENASKMEWKLQSATTRIKIAGAYRLAKDFGSAIQNYSEAIERETKLFAENPTDKILRSNLASAYEGRARLQLETETPDAAFADFANAARLFNGLYEEDPGDTRWLERLAQVRSKFGRALEDNARSRHEPLDKAIEQYKGEVSARSRLAQRDPKNTALQEAATESLARLERTSGIVMPGVRPAR
jgi:tetratricopeptide (TPR) repeat protein